MEKISNKDEFAMYIFGNLTNRIELDFPAWRYIEDEGYCIEQLIEYIEDEKNKKIFTLLEEIASSMARNSMKNIYLNSDKFLDYLALKEMILLELVKLIRQYIN